jgi:hypothetical protein
MRQLTINIPDYYYQAFLEYFKHIPEASLVNDSSFVLDKEMIALLDKRSNSPKESFLSREQSNEKIKEIRGV